jgi:hypothetical protein
LIGTVGSANLSVSYTADIFEKDKEALGCSEEAEVGQVQGQFSNVLGLRTMAYFSALRDAVQQPCTPVTSQALVLALGAVLIVDSSETRLQRLANRNQAL